MGETEKGRGDSKYGVARAVLEVSMGCKLSGKPGVVSVLTALFFLLSTGQTFHWFCTHYLLIPPCLCTCSSSTWNVILLSSWQSPSRPSNCSSRHFAQGTSPPLSHHPTKLICLCAVCSVLSIVCIIGMCLAPFLPFCM